MRSTINDHSDQRSLRSPITITPRSRDHGELSLCIIDKQGTERFLQETDFLEWKGFLGTERIHTWNGTDAKGTERINTGSGTDRSGTERIYTWTGTERNGYHSGLSEHVCLGWAGCSGWLSWMPGLADLAELGRWTGWAADLGWLGTHGWAGWLSCPG